MVKVFIDNKEMRGLFTPDWIQTHDKKCIIEGREVEYNKIFHNTGIKDKNGKEIYEDDILEFVNKACIIKVEDGHTYIVNIEDGEKFLLFPTNNLDKNIYVEKKGHLYESEDILTHIANAYIKNYYTINCYHNNVEPEEKDIQQFIDKYINDVVKWIKDNKNLNEFIFDFCPF